MAERKEVAYFNEVSVKQVEVSECFVKIAVKRFTLGKNFVNGAERIYLVKAM